MLNKSTKKYLTLAAVSVSAITTSFATEGYEFHQANLNAIALLHEIEYPSEAPAEEFPPSIFTPDDDSDEFPFGSAIRIIFEIGKMIRQVQAKEIVRHEDACLPAEQNMPIAFNAIAEPVPLHIIDVAPPNGWLRDNQGQLALEMEALFAGIRQREAARQRAEIIEAQRQTRRQAGLRASILGRGNAVCGG